MGCRDRTGPHGSHALRLPGTGSRTFRRSCGLGPNGTRRDQSRSNSRSRSSTSTQHSQRRRCVRLRPPGNPARGRPAGTLQRSSRSSRSTSRRAARRLSWQCWSLSSPICSTRERPLSRGRFVAGSVAVAGIALVVFIAGGNLIGKTFANNPGLQAVPSTFTQHPLRVLGLPYEMRALRLQHSTFKWTPLPLWERRTAVQPSQRPAGFSTGLASGSGGQVVSAHSHASRCRGTRTRPWTSPSSTGG